MHPIEKRPRKETKNDHMKEEQRTNRRKRQNTLEAYQQKNNHRNMKKDALCAESIAMDNPLWYPEMQSPIPQAQRVATLEAAWNNPDFFNPTWRPLSIFHEFEQSRDIVDDDVNDMRRLSQHGKVTHGERRALRVQQNRQFQDKCVNRPSAPSDEDDDAMAPTLHKEHQVDDNRMFLISLFF
jgi:hypothetical protein